MAVYVWSDDIYTNTVVCLDKNIPRPFIENICAQTRITFQDPNPQSIGDGLVEVNQQS